MEDNYIDDTLGNFPLFTNNIFTPSYLSQLSFLYKRSLFLILKLLKCSFDMLLYNLLICIQTQSADISNFTLDCTQYLILKIIGRKRLKILQTMLNIPLPFTFQPRTTAHTTPAMT